MRGENMRQENLVSKVFNKKVADEAFEEIGVSKGAAQLIKCRLQKTNQIEETFLKYVEHKFEA